MIHSYYPVFLAFSFAMVLAVILLTLGSLIGPRRPNPSKGEPFECGIPSAGTENARFSIRFFLVAVLFLLFDVEAVFLFPWATVFRQFISQGAGLFIFMEMVFFLSVLMLGWYYVWKKGALKWE